MAKPTRKIIVVEVETAENNVALKEIVRDRLAGAVLRVIQIQVNRVQGKAKAKARR